MWGVSLQLQTRVSPVSKTRPERIVSSIPRPPAPVLWLLGIALMLFTVQPWSVEVAEIPLQVILIWILAGWLILFRTRFFARTLLLFSPFQWSLLVVLGAAIFLRSALDGWEMLRFIQFSTGLLIAFCTCALFKHEQVQKVIFFALALASAVSGAVAILQLAGYASWTWERTVYMTLHGGWKIGAPTGLETSSVAFPFSMLGIGIVLLFSWIVQRRTGVVLVRISLIPALVMLLAIFTGLFVTQSRSGILSVAGGILLLMVGTRRLSLKFLPTTAIVLAAIMCVAYAQFVKDGTDQDARLGATWAAYGPVLWHFPFGKPQGLENLDVLDAVSLGTADEEYGLAIEQLMFRGKAIAPHNFFLTTGVEFGPGAAVALLLLYGSALWEGLKRFGVLRRAKDTIPALWLLAFLTANTCLIIHSCFHNANLATGEMRNWLWLGLLLFVSRPGAEQWLRLRGDGNDRGSWAGR